MSMTMLTVLQFISVFCAYSFVVLVLPALVFRPLLRGRRIPEQFLLCLLIGNFFVMNLVFALQLLHISGTVTLILTTVIIVTIAGVKLNKINVRELFSRFMKGLRKINDRKIGKKTLLYHMGCRLAAGCRWFAKEFYRIVIKKCGQWLWVLLIFGVLFMVYGPHFLEKYGYTASDIPVHLYWINSMKDNEIFVAGVYPFGFHCVSYYINEVFGIDIYVIMRVMAFVQNIYINLVLLAFLKLCCRNKYIPYAAVFMFIAGRYYNANTYYRYFASLPQEFGMIFILPAIYFGFKFFEQRREELKAGEKKKKESLVCLVGFAMSFGMTLSVHFYGTMIAGLFCVAMAVGYFLLFVRKKYFWNIIVTCMLSVLVAVLPMAIAYATGTQLEGSLRWGMSVMSGSSGSDDEEETEAETSTDEETESAVTAAETAVSMAETPDSAETETELQIKAMQSSVTGVQTEASDSGNTESLSEKLQKMYSQMRHNVRTYVFSNEYMDMYWLVFAMIVLVLVLGVIFQIAGKYCYGSMLLSCGVFMVIMTVLLSASELGLPSLMDAGRCSIYYAYATPVLFAFCVDGVLNLIFWWSKLDSVKNLVALAVAAGCCILLNQQGLIKGSTRLTTLETNEAVTCLTNIIREEKDYTWTICSANDETQMGKEHGYHYETIDFLRSMEGSGENASIIIPTETVYFFIEKRPIDYTVPYENSGQIVSKAGAMNEVPGGSGLQMYQGENRWIVMSRMYYWAQEFQRMYPNEMTVYCETENFVCYKIEQNPYRLYNFAIDYGYNTR